MSDSTMNGGGSGSGLPALIMVAKVLMFFRIRLRYCERSDDTIFIFVDDLLAVIGKDLTTAMRGILMRFIRLENVSVDGVVQAVRVIEEKEFYYFCRVVGSPQLEPYRRQAEEIFPHIRAKGYYVDPGAAVSVVDLGGLDRSKPVVAGLLAALEALKAADQAHIRLDAFQVEQDKIKAIAEKAEANASLAVQTVKTHPGWMALRAYASLHGIILPRNVARCEAYILKPRYADYLKEHSMQKQYVPDERDGEVLIYPPGLLEWWLADYQKRYPLVKVRPRR